MKSIFLVTLTLLLSLADAKAEAQLRTLGELKAKFMQANWIWAHQVMAQKDQLAACAAGSSSIAQARGKAVDEVYSHLGDSRGPFSKVGEGSAFYHYVRLNAKVLTAIYKVQQIAGNSLAESDDAVKNLRADLAETEFELNLLLANLLRRTDAVVRARAPFQAFAGNQAPACANGGAQSYQLAKKTATELQDAVMQTISHAQRAQMEFAQISARLGQERVGRFSAK